MKKLLLFCLLFVSLESFSQTFSNYHLYNDKLLITTAINSNKKNYNNYATKVARRERIIGGTIFGSLLLLFVKGCIDTYKINKN